MKLEFKHRPDRQYAFEHYFQPHGLLIGDLYSWCWDAFGPLGGTWDAHGGWIKLKSEKELTLFLLRWS